MRISPDDLHAVTRAGALTRYALLGPAAFVLMEFPATGTEGTGLDQPCLIDHHGIVTKGTFNVHGMDGTVTSFHPGDAFYVPPGPPAHSFSCSPGCVVGGFAPVTEPPDTSSGALEAQGFEVVSAARPPLPPPTTVKLAGAVVPFTRSGAVAVEGSPMGDWLFMRARFGPRSGYTGGLCELTHWGIVLDGEIAIEYDAEVELASRGDVFLADPGHRFTSPDGATVIDYTPIAELGTDRIASWRKAAIARATSVSVAALPPARAVVLPAGATLRRPRRVAPAPA